MLASDSSQLADIDGDGRLDYVSGSAAAAVRYYHGNGDGTFAASTSYALNASNFSVSITFADLDGDDVKDLAVAGFSGNAVDVFLQDSVTISGLPDVDLTTQAGALEAIDAMQAVQTTLDSVLSSIGAAQSRLEAAGSGFLNGERCARELANRT